jgi:hypothetical protein
MKSTDYSTSSYNLDKKVEHFQRPDVSESHSYINNIQEPHKLTIDTSALSLSDQAIRDKEA